MEKYKVIILIVLILALGLVFAFQGSIIRFYNYLGINLHQTDKTDIGNVIKEIAKEVLTSSPLNIGGKENQVILVKEKIIAQTNIQRYNNGLLPPLIENAKLTAAAQAKAEGMFKNQYFEHTAPSGVGPGELAKNFGYDFLMVGENLILGNFTSEQQLVQDWMDSPGHRANILNEKFTQIGVAVARGTYKGQTVWIGVQEFGLPLPNCPEPSISLKNKIDLGKSQLDQTSLQINAKREEIDNTPPVSEDYNTLVDEHNKLVEKYNLLNVETKKIISQYNIQVNNFNQCVVGK